MLQHRVKGRGRRGGLQVSGLGFRVVQTEPFSWVPEPFSRVPEPSSWAPSAVPFSGRLSAWLLSLSPLFRAGRWQDEAVKEYHELRLSLAQLARKLRDHVMRPDRCLPFLLPGRLVRALLRCNLWLACNLCQCGDRGL